MLQLPILTFCQNDQKANPDIHFIVSALIDGCLRSAPEIANAGPVYEIGE